MLRSAVDRVTNVDTASLNENAFIYVFNCADALLQRGLTSEAEKMSLQAQKMVKSMESFYQNSSHLQWRMMIEHRCEEQLNQIRAHRK